ncbi:hypothetical protein [Pseudogemmobacter sp. W21_MBD1_M6]|uniref:hypothetical protein n=1 Tax=Pseudogemmobacter sp. W21_MBD1_M6 TaxID=3240271 RepID=UPI003F95E07F
MNNSPEKIISDEEITRVHGYANFGSMTPREVVNDDIRKYAVGYTGGSTQVAILREHGLITKPNSNSYRANLTEKGKRYARALHRDATTHSKALAAKTQVLLSYAWHDRICDLTSAFIDGKSCTFGFDAALDAFNARRLSLDGAA